jgi:hypothetical protein
VPAAPRFASRWKIWQKSRVSYRAAHEHDLDVISLAWSPTKQRRTALRRLKKRKLRLKDMIAYLETS